MVTGEFLYSEYYRRVRRIRIFLMSLFELGGLLILRGKLLLWQHWCHPHTLHSSPNVVCGQAGSWSYKFGRSLRISSSTHWKGQRRWMDVLAGVFWQRKWLASWEQQWKKACKVEGCKQQLCHWGSRSEHGNDWLTDREEKPAILAYQMHIGCVTFFEEKSSQRLQNLTLYRRPTCFKIVRSAA